VLDGGMAMVNLPEKYRSALRGKYVEGKSLEEMAREAGASLDAIKGLLRRARTAFKQAFAALAGARPYLDDLGVSR
jgi:DNA-directed RNA polymerase specialized sigma24 family protein